MRKVMTSRVLLSAAEHSEKRGIAVPLIYMIERRTNCTLKTLLKMATSLG